MRDRETRRGVTGSGGNKERGDKENVLNEILCVSLRKSFAVLRGLIFFTADLPGGRQGCAKKPQRAPEKLENY